MCFPYFFSAPPRLPTHRPIITDIGEEMVRLAWRPVESYKSKRIPPVSYQLEAKELPGKDWMPISTRLRDTTHYLSELEGDRDYMIRVRAENDFGVSEPTEPLWLPRARGLTNYANKLSFCILFGCVMTDVYRLTDTLKTMKPLLYYMQEIFLKKKHTL